MSTTTNRILPNPYYDRRIKVLLIGESGVGKSNLLLRFADNSFSPSFISTIGIDFKEKNVDIDDKVIKLQVWDTAGQERFRTIVAAYYRSAQGVILVYDVTDARSFNNVKSWIQNIHQNCTEGIRIILVANKIDLKDMRIIDEDRGKELALQYGIEYFETSAKTGANVETAFAYLARQIYYQILEQEAEREQRLLTRGSSGSNGAVKLDDDSKKIVTKKKCC